jgi:Flp pilus assembly protein CpaB
MSKGLRIFVAIAFGLLAALFGMLYLNSRSNQILGSAEVVRVYAAAQDIKPNTAIDKDMLTVIQVPKKYLQPQCILVSEFPDKAKVKGVTLVPIKEGEQIVRSKLYEGAPPPLSTDLKPGMVAVGINVEALPNAVHGLLRAGDHVDVLASFKFEKSKDEDFTEIRPLYQNIEVLAVNEKTAGSRVVSADKTKTDEPDKIIRSVTLAMSPPAAQQVVLAQQLGNVWFLLRAPGDTAQHQYEIWNNERLLQSPYRLWHAQTREDLMRDMLKQR